MKKHLKEGDYIRVEWTDAAGISDETDLAEAKRLNPIKTVTFGQLVEYIAHKKVTLASTVFGDGPSQTEFKGVLTIPLGMVNGIYRLIDVTSI